MSNSKFDLLTTVEYGGCSAKIPQDKLREMLGGLPMLQSSEIMVDISNHDDAGVYRINEDTALIVTTDFFPPICSDPYTFGKIAAANSLSDVYAMGGKPLLVLNLNMFPSQQIDLSVLREILEGGHDTIAAAGAFVMGGHTIEDAPPKYGLAVVGTIHPDKLVTNKGAKVGQKLLLTKPLGTGILVAAQRLEMCSSEAYAEALKQMALLNDKGGAAMVNAGVRCATDVTGFGLLGHLVNMAKGSECSIQIDFSSVPLLPEVYDLAMQGCISGAGVRNLKSVKEDVHFAATLAAEQRMILCDAQTSGGLLMAVDSDKVDQVLEELREVHPWCSVIGEVIPKRESSIYCV